MPTLRIAILAMALAAPFAAAQDPARDLRPLPDAHDPVGLSASAFHVWVATRTSLSRWSRISDDAPLWYGAGRGLPESGIADICWDSPTGKLLIHGVDGSSYVWSESGESATLQTERQGCTSAISRAVSVDALPSLIPQVDGWVYMDGTLREPAGRHASIRQALVIEDRELWLATSNAGIWKGRWPSGRVTPMASGLGETCVKRAVAEKDGTVWMLGCSGNLARLGRDGALQAVDPRSPRWSSLRDAIDLVSSASSGVWVATHDGVVRINASSVEESYTGRNAPFGGAPLALARLEDTVWCLTDHGLGRSVDEGPFEAMTTQDSAGQPLQIQCIAPLASGLLAGTVDGFRQWNGKRWVRPANLARVESRIVRKIAIEPGNLRIAWSDGLRIRVDTLPGSHGRSGTWNSAKGEIADFAWGRDGLLQIAHGSWTLWNPDNGLERTWSLPVEASLVVPGSLWTFLAGSTGGIQARTSAWSP